MTKYYEVTTRVWETRDGEQYAVEGVHVIASQKPPMAEDYRHHDGFTWGTKLVSSRQITEEEYNERSPYTPRPAAFDWSAVNAGFLTRLQK